MSLASIVQAWVLFPAVVAIAALGWGLLVDRAAGRRLGGALLAPIGLATLVVLARLLVEVGASTWLTTPFVALGSLVGLWLGRGRLRGWARHRWTIAAAFAVLATFAAPVVLGGSATFAGYTILGDTAIHFTLVDRLAEHGTDRSGLAPSSYDEALESYFGSGYPLGTHAVLAVLRPLAFTDVAWVFQPFLAILAAMLALTLAGLLDGVVRRGWRLAAVAALAAQPALVYAFALQGSVKELATLWLVPLIAATVAWMARTARPERLGERLGQLLPLAIASGAGIAAIGLAVAAWLGPMLLAALAVTWHRERGRVGGVAVLAAAFIVSVAVLSIPTLTASGRYVEVTQTVVTAQEELGNLAGPLDPLQVGGIWLSGDYRFPPAGGSGLSAQELTYALLGIVAVAALLGLLWLARRRALGALLFFGSSLLALWYVMRSGSPWADGKALTIASPAVLMTAALGPVALEARGMRLEALLVALALGAGVVASNALAYHDASLAPRDRLEELASVGERAAGDGPLLYTEFEEFGKHFLRGAQPVGASEAFHVEGLSPGLRAGGAPAFGHPTDVRDLDPIALDRFETLVKRRTPFGERPPGDWELAWSGRYYELWRNGGRGVGGGTEGRAGAGCPDPPRFEPSQAELPAAWTATSDSPVVQTVGPGAVTGTVDVPEPGAYEVWLSGSFGREVTVSVDGRRVGSIEDELSQPAAWVELGEVQLDGGPRPVEIVRGGGNLEPGNGDGPRRLGSLVLRPVDADAAGCGRRR